MEENQIYIPVHQEDYLENGILFQKRKESQVIIINNNQPSPIEQPNIISTEAQIISLDKIHNYSNIFIAVHPFIMNGYRIHHNIKDCLISIFKIHNETFNIWSHLISFIIFLVLSISIFSNNKTETNHTIMITIYMISTMNCFICSSIYHTYNSHSHSVANCVFKIDLFGIILQLGAATIASQHFMFHDFDSIRNIYVGVFATICFLILIFLNIPFFMKGSFDGIRIFLISSMFLLSFFSCVHWAAIAKIEEVEQLTVFIYMAWGCMFVGFFFYFSKFPECQYQGYYIDIYLQSHTLWHWCVFACAMNYFLLIYKYNQLITT